MTLWRFVKCLQDWHLECWHLGKTRPKLQVQKQALRGLTLMQKAFWVVLWQLINRGFATVIPILNTKAWKGGIEDFRHTAILNNLENIGVTIIFLGLWKNSIDWVLGTWSDNYRPILFNISYSALWRHQTEKTRQVVAQNALSSDNATVDKFTRSCS